MSGIRFGGLASNLDTNTLIEQLMMIERRPVTLLENQQKIFQYKKDQWNQINSSLLALDNKLNALIDPLTFNSQRANFTDEDIASVTLDKKAQIGLYDIEVIQLAERYAAELTKAGVGNFEIADKSGNGIKIEVNVYDRLEDIRDKINKAVKLHNDDPDNKDYKLEMSATIINGKLLINSNLELEYEGDALSSSKIQGSGAKFKVNGILIDMTDNSENPSGIYTNEFSDIVDGMSIDLKAVGKTRMKVENDVDKAVDTIKEFINQYNALMDLINTRLSEEKGNPNETANIDPTKGLLRADYSLISLKSNLRLNVTNRIEGITGYNQIAQIGINTSSENFGTTGKLEIVDEEKLRKALETDPQAVKDILTKSSDNPQQSGIAVRIQQQMKLYTDRFDGIITNKSKGLQRQIDDYAKEIDAYDERLSKVEERYVRQFTQMERVMSSMQNQASWFAAQINMYYNQ